MSNTILLTGQAREDYIKAHFTPDMVVPETLMIEETVSPEFIKAREDFATWYDSKDEDTQELIDEIADRTYYIIEENEYDEFISELDSEGITTASEFEDRFEVEVESESDLYDWCESMMDDCGYLREVPSFISNHIDYKAIWDCELRFDYSTIEFNGKTYLFHN